jgi:hypothetical protein
MAMADLETDALIERVTAEHRAMLALMSGRERLWLWFGLSRASWLTMPRVMMHAMSDDWQRRMAELCEEWDATWSVDDTPTPHVSAKDRGRFTAWPDWVLNYRHPDHDEIARRKRALVPVEGGGGRG